MDYYQHHLSNDQDQLIQNSLLNIFQFSDRKFLKKVNLMNKQQLI